MKRIVTAAAASIILPSALLLHAPSASAVASTPQSMNSADGGHESLLTLTPNTETYRLAKRIGRADAVRSQADGDPAPAGATIVSPATGTDVAGDFQVTVSRGSAVNLSIWLDGQYYANDAGTDATVAFPLSIDGPAAGQNHTIEVGDCASGSCPTSADGVVSQSISVKAYPAVGVDVTSASSSGYFSPDADGTNDSVTVQYATQVAGTVKASVIRLSDSVTVREVVVGAKASGTGSFVWNGKGGAGTVVADGVYRIVVGVTTSGGSTTSDGVDVVLDTKDPSLSNLAKSDTKVFPRKDGYRDSVTFSAKLSERASLVQLRITTSAGKAVRTLSASSVAGTVRLAWNGRTATGVLPAAGNYTYRWTTRDLAGNSKTTASGSITVDTRILKKKVRTKTLTPVKSTFVSWIGDCSRLAKNPNGWSGGHGYWSLWKALNEKSCSGLDDENSGTDNAYVRYKFVAPKAVKYGSVKIGALGKSHPFTYRGDSYTSTAGLYLMGFDGTELFNGSYVKLAPKYKTYWTGSRSFSDLGWGRTVLWDAGTAKGNRYDVRKFTVRWSYYVLVK